MVQIKLYPSNSFQSLCLTIRHLNQTKVFWTIRGLANLCTLHDEKWMTTNQCVPSLPLNTSMNHFVSFLQPSVTDNLNSAVVKHIAWTELIQYHNIQYCICSILVNIHRLWYCWPPGQCLLTPYHSSGLQFDSSKWTGDIQCQTFIFTIKCYLQGTRVSPLRINPKWLS